MGSMMRFQRWLPVLLLLAVPACWSLSLTVVKEECVSEEVRYAGDSVSGNFVVEDYELFWGTDHPGIDLTVISEQGEHIYEAKGKEEHEFHFTAHKAGIYKFCFKNPSAVPEYITFYIHVGHVPHRGEVAEDEHFNVVDERIAELREALEEIYAEQKYLGLRNTRHHKTNQSTKKRLLFYTLTEYLVLVLASTIQVYLIRRRFSRQIGYNKF